MPPIQAGLHDNTAPRTLSQSLLIGSVMTIVMLGFMWSMYEGEKVKIGVLLGSAGPSAREPEPEPVDDPRSIKSMIPHHSIAINNAREADKRDPRVRQLGDEIIASQVREIRTMKLLIEDIPRNGRRGERRLPARAAVVTPDMEPRIQQAVR